jgi:diguanylate cyclase (GGDEF)-like protein
VPAAVTDALSADERQLSPELLAVLVDRINVGVITVSPEMTVLQWNRFMQAHSGLAAADLLGRNLFEQFPELPRPWLERKIRSVFLLKTFAFTSWRRRPYVFGFKDHRLITGDTEAMRQDCAFVPLIEAGVVRAVSIVLIDATDTFESQRRLDLALADLAAQSERDGLTGIYNRRKLEQSLEVEVSRARRYEGQLSVLMFDIDHFKKVNDRFGHLVGDDTIRHVAKVALETLRTSDLLGRYGGEEFLALLPEVGIEGAMVAAERIRKAVAERPVHSAGKEVSVTISVGGAAFSPAQATGLVLVDQADQALYRSKTAGRNRVTSF